MGGIERLLSNSNTLRCLFLIVEDLNEDIVHTQKFYQQNTTRFSNLILTSLAYQHSPQENTATAATFMSKTQQKSGTGDSWHPRLAIIYQVLGKPDIVSSMRRIVTACAQLVPKAAIRWESHLEVSSKSWRLVPTAHNTPCGSSYKNTMQ